MTGKFSIKDLERLSGIKAHTIRIWEQRYHLFNPERTDTNIRYYTNNDLKLILNISLLNNHGIKISKIASLNEEEIFREVNKLVKTESSDSDQLNKLIVSLIDLDETKFNEVVTQSIATRGFQDTVLTILYPFLEKIGIMWMTGTINPAQEHFISNLIRQKFITAIDQLTVARKEDAKKIVLFLPENELHEIGLLFYNYILRQQGHQTIYLGQSVPFEDLKKITMITQADYLLTILTNPIQEDSLEAYLEMIETTFPSFKFILTGHQFSENKFKSRRNILVPTSLDEMLSLLQQL